MTLKYLGKKFSDVNLPRGRGLYFYTKFENEHLKGVLKELK